MSWARSSDVLDADQLLVEIWKRPVHTTADVIRRLKVRKKEWSAWLTELREAGLYDWNLCMELGWITARGEKRAERLSMGRKRRTQ